MSAMNQSANTNPRFRAERLAVAGTNLQQKINLNLESGADLRQFQGFDESLKFLLLAVPEVASVVVSDVAGQVLFQHVRNGQVAHVPARFKPKTEGAEANHIVQWDNHVLRVVLPVRNKFELAGYVTLALDRDAPRRQIAEQFQVLPMFLAPVWLVTALLLAILIKPDRRLFGRSRSIFMGAFFVASVLVFMIVIGVYQRGVEMKGQAMVDHFARKFEQFHDLGLVWEDLRGLELMLEEFARTDPDIGQVVVVRQDIAVLHPIASLRGRAFETPDDVLVFRTPVAAEISGTELVLTLEGTSILQAARASARQFLPYYMTCLAMSVLLMLLAEKRRSLFIGGQV